jgi:hypothetical protein
VSIEEDKQRYLNALHALQSVVAFSQNYGKDTSPKHLRVGVASAMVSISAVAALLIHKGIFTEEEYAVVLAKMMEQEVEDLKAELPEHLRGLDFA